jgi:hypothetical protein
MSLPLRKVLIEKNNLFVTPIIETMLIILLTEGSKESTNLIL